MTEPPTKKQKLSVEEPVLYSYWRSSCSWRVRIALELKEKKYAYKAVNLLKGEQASEEHVSKRNVMAQVPAFEVGGDIIAQSLAILEYIEETADGHALLPKSPIQRAKVREICNIISSGIQPIQNLAVIKKVAADFGEEHKMPWGKYWIEQGFVSLEKELAKYVTLHPHTQCKHQKRPPKNFKPR